MYKIDKIIEKYNQLCVSEMHILFLVSCFVDFISTLFLVDGINTIEINPLLVSINTGNYILFSLIYLVLTLKTLIIFSIILTSKKKLLMKNYEYIKFGYFGITILIFFTGLGNIIRFIY